MTRKDYDDYVARFKVFVEREGINTLTPVSDRADGEWEYYFTWRKCSACGDTDGGNRAQCVGFNPTTHEIQSGYEVCENCVYFAVYGQLDDMTMLEVAQDEERIYQEDNKRIEEIFRAYVRTALWSSNDDDDEPLDDTYDQSDIAESALERMRDDCAKFYTDNKADCVEACENGGMLRYGPDFDQWERIGHDFWLTRNGHGTGFWDGDYPDELGKRLTDASHKFGEADLYVGDDGMIYHFPA